MRFAALFAVLPIAFSLAVVTGPAALATDTTITLPMSSFSDIVVDPAHGHVFVTGGYGSDGVLIRDLDGAAVTTIANEPGASGMVLSPDGATLYVGLTGAIAAIDTATLTESVRYSLGTLDCPFEMATALTKIWFVYGCSSPNIGVLDLATDPPTATGNRTSGWGMSSASDLLVTPDGSYLLANGAVLYAVDGVTLTIVKVVETDYPPRAAALLPDGATFVTAAELDVMHEYHIPDLTLTASFGAQGQDAGRPTDIEVAPNGVVARGLKPYTSTQPVADLYAPDGTLLREIPGQSGPSPVANGMALTPDASRLFLVVAGSGIVRLRVVTDPSKQVSTIGLVPPSSAKVDVAHLVTGTLTAPKQPPAGTLVHVTRSSKYGIVPLPDVALDGAGAFQLTDTVHKRGAYTYTVSYDGDDTHLAGAGNTTFTVLGRTPSLTLTTDKSQYGYHTYATVKAHLGPTATNRVVKLTKVTWGLDYGPTVKHAAVDANGYLTAQSYMSTRSVFWAIFDGDDVYEPRYVTRAVWVTPKLTATVSGYYTTSGSTYVYHSSVRPVLTVTVAPSQPNRCVTYTAQRYYSAAWHTVASSSCVALSSTSSARITFAAARYTGSTYRIRAAWPGTDHLAPTTSIWRYFRFTT